MEEVGVRLLGEELRPLGEGAQGGVLLLDGEGRPGLYPFGLRLRRRTGLLLSAGYFLLSCALLALVSGWVSVNGRRNEPVRNAVMAAILAAYLAWWGLQVRVPRVRKLLVAGMMIHYAAILNALASNAAALVRGDGYLIEVNTEAGSRAYVLCALAVTLLTWPLVWQFCRRVLRRTLPLLDGRETRRGLGYICAMFVLFYGVSFFLPYGIQPSTALITASLVLAEAIVYHVFFREIGAVHRQAETARELAVWQMQYKQLSRAIEETRRLRHDLRHHLNALSAQGRQEEIGAYLKRYGTVYDQLEKQRFSGDPVVDSLLEYYLAQAGEDGVRVESRISLNGPTGMEAMDMTVLLGNCLENALEALRELPEEERRLSIEIARSGAALLVRIKNASRESGSGEFAGWESFLSHKGKDRESLGLRSVSAIAEKYGGAAQFRYGDGEFIARVALNPAGLQP